MIQKPMSSFVIRLLGSSVALIVAALASVLGASRAVADPVDNYLKTEMKRNHIPGLTVAIVREGKLLKLKAYGQANLEWAATTTTDTAFPLASARTMLCTCSLSGNILDPSDSNQPWSSSPHPDQGKLSHAPKRPDAQTPQTAKQHAPLTQQLPTTHTNMRTYKHTRVRARTHIHMWPYLDTAFFYKRRWCV